MMRRVAGTSSIAAAGLAAIVALAACGSGAPQDAHAPTGTFRVSVPTASFPASQRLAEHTSLVISVRNDSSRTIPNVAVTICNVTCRWPAPVGEGTSVAAFADYLNMPGLANHSRQVWIIDQPPGPCAYSCQNGGAGSAFTVDANTWALGALKPGHTATFVWHVTAVAPGRHVVAWEVAGDIYGKARAVLADGSLPHGVFTVNISPKPALTHVNDAGQVVPGQ
jgi:hypothetical protein